MQTNDSHSYARACAGRPRAKGIEKIESATRPPRAIACGTTRAPQFFEVREKSSRAAVEAPGARRRYIMKRARARGAASCIKIRGERERDRSLTRAALSYACRGEVTPEDDGLADGAAVLQAAGFPYQEPRRHRTLPLQPAAHGPCLRTR